jgi:hypothetical protein
VRPGPRTPRSVRRGSRCTTGRRTLAVRTARRVIMRGLKAAREESEQPVHVATVSHVRTNVRPMNAECSMMQHLACVRMLAARRDHLYTSQPDSDSYLSFTESLIPARDTAARTRTTHVANTCPTTGSSPCGAMPCWRAVRRRNRGAVRGPDRRRCARAAAGWQQGAGGLLPIATPGVEVGVTARGVERSAAPVADRAVDGAAIEHAARERGHPAGRCVQSRRSEPASVLMMPARATRCFDRETTLDPTQRGCARPTRPGREPWKRGPACVGNVTRARCSIQAIGGVEWTA